MCQEVNWVTVAMLVVALAAVIVGPTIQLVIAKRQLRATVLSANRQNWINNLRDQLAEFVALASSLKADSATHVLSTQEFLQSVNKANYLAAKIRLLLNTNEEDHRHLEVLVSDAVQGYRTPSEVIPSNIPEIISHSQKVLKREWERVKRLD